MDEIFNVGETILMDGNPLVVRPNYIVIYAEDAITVTILRVLHAAQQWPET